MLFGELCLLVGLVLWADPERDGGDLDLDKNLFFASCPEDNAQTACIVTRALDHLLLKAD